MRSYAPSMQSATPTLGPRMALLSPMWKVRRADRLIDTEAGWRCDVSAMRSRATAEPLAGDYYNECMASDVEGATPRDRFQVFSAADSDDATIARYGRAGAQLTERLRILMCRTAPQGGTRSNR